MNRHTEDIRSNWSRRAALRCLRTLARHDGSMTARQYALAVDCVSPRDDMRAVEADYAHFDAERKRLRSEVGGMILGQKVEGIEAPGIGKVYARTTVKGNVTINTNWE